MTEQEELQIIDNFFFLIFSPNPIRQVVSIIVDDNVLKTVLTRKDFVAVINKLCGGQLATKCDLAAQDYGGYFMVDRTKGTVQYLQPDMVESPLLIKNIRDDISKAIEEDKKSTSVEDNSILWYSDKVLNPLNKKQKQEKQAAVKSGYIKYK